MSTHVFTKSKLTLAATAFTLAIFALFLMPVQAHATNSGSAVSVSSVVSTKTNDHILTCYPTEQVKALGSSWKNEGVKFKTPQKSSTPVFRLYKSKPASGKNVTHYYTTSATKRDQLVKQGWTWESKNYKGTGEGGGGAFYSSDKKEAAVYQMYNATTAQYYYTKDTKERDALVKKGWKNEGTAFYALSESTAASQNKTANVTSAGVATANTSGNGDSGAWVAVHRLVSSTDNDHCYTVYPKEQIKVVKVFKQESSVSGNTVKGNGWWAPNKSNTPVYRLYLGKPASGKKVTHYYTTSATKRDQLVKQGWTWES